MFRYKDYAHQSQQRTMTLAAAEFIRRFLLHVLPDGFMRIRHYGYLANRHRREKLETCRRLLGVRAHDRCGCRKRATARTALPRHRPGGVVHSLSGLQDRTDVAD